MKLKIGIIMIILNIFQIMFQNLLINTKKNYLQNNQLFFNYYQNCKKKNPNITLITKGEQLEF